MVLILLNKHLVLECQAGLRRRRGMSLSVESGAAVYAHVLIRPFALALGLLARRERWWCR